MWLHLVMYGISKVATSSTSHCYTALIRECRSFIVKPMCKFLGSEVPRAASLLVRVGCSQYLCCLFRHLRWHQKLAHGVSHIPLSLEGEISYCRVSVLASYS